MEISLITLDLFIVLLLPSSLRTNGLTWAIFAISILLITSARHIVNALKQPTLSPKETQHDHHNHSASPSNESQRGVVKALIHTYR